MFGGVGTVWGPVIGSVILIPLAESSTPKLGSRFPGIQGVIYGLAIIMRHPGRAGGPVLESARFLRKRSAPPAAATPSRAGCDDCAPPRCTGAIAARTPARRRRCRPRGARTCRASFGGLKAVQDVSFKLRRNEILGIIGPNGAGKTTVFNLLNGFLRPGRRRNPARRARHVRPQAASNSARPASAAPSRSCARSCACRSRTMSWSAPMSAPRPMPRQGSWRPTRSPASACPRSPTVSPANSRPRNCG